MIRRVALLTSLSIGSFMFGVYFERNFKLQYENPFKSHVVYARSITDSPNENDMKVVESTVLKNANLSEVMKFGFPSFDNLRLFDDFVLSYDRRNRIANWVFERINKDTIRYNKTIDRSKSEFKPDETIHEYFRAQNSDFRKSGYHRGHLAAAGNHKHSQKHLDDTFYLSNIAPQVGKGFNVDKWNSLEKYVRKLTKRYRNIYCCTGPLFLPYHEKDGKTYVKYEVIGKNFVSVPTHFFKVIFCENDDNSLDIEAYVLPNIEIPDETPLKIYQVSPDTIERAAGLLILNKIPSHLIKSINQKPK